MAVQESPVTGVIQEDQVVIDFGEYEGRSVLEISDVDPDFYKLLIEAREKGYDFSIKRLRDKTFRLYAYLESIQ